MSGPFRFARLLPLLVGLVLAAVALLSGCAAVVRGVQAVKSGAVVGGSSAAGAGVGYLVGGPTAILVGAAVGGVAGEVIDERTDARDPPVVVAGHAAPTSGLTRWGPWLAVLGLGGAALAWKARGRLAPAGAVLRGLLTAFLGRARITPPLG